MRPISATLRIYFDDKSSTVYKQICFDMWPEKGNYLVEVVFVGFFGVCQCCYGVFFVSFTCVVICVFISLFLLFVLSLYLGVFLFVLFVVAFCVISNAADKCNLHNSVISTL